MKYFTGVALTIILSLFANQAHAEMHAFSLPDGRALSAEIVDYNAKLGKVELKLANGKRKKVKPSIFVEADQAYIKEWVALSAFQKDSALRVDCTKKIFEKWKKESSVQTIKYQKVGYEILLENRTPAPLKGLKAEYRVYYEQEKTNPGQSKKTLSKQTKKGVFELTQLAAKQKKEFATEPVQIEFYDFNSGDYYYTNGDPESTYGEVKGIWFRITMETATGQTVVRNVFEPASIRGRYKW